MPVWAKRDLRMRIGTLSPGHLRGPEQVTKSLQKEKKNRGEIGPRFRETMTSYMCIFLAARGEFIKEFGGSYDERLNEPIQRTSGDMRMPDRKSSAHHHLAPRRETLHVIKNLQHEIS